MLLARKRTNRHFVAAIVAAALLTAAFGLWVTFRFGGVTLSERIDDLGEAFVAFIAAIACGAAARRRVGRSRLAWLLIAGSAFVWSAGEAVWSYYEVGLGKQVPFPSLADAGFLGAVPLAVAGVLLFRAGTPRAVTRLAAVLDGSIIAGSLLAVSWTTILETISDAGGSSPIAQVISLAYPISDVVILTMLLLLLAGRVPGPERVCLFLLAGGLLANLLADSGFAYLTTVNSYGPAQPIDTGWVAGYFLIAVAGFRAWQIPAAAPRRIDQLQTGWRLLLLYIPMAAAVIASFADRLLSGSVDDFLFFDLVIAHTVYSHLVDPREALAEARRVLRPGGQLVIFDGDFATLTVALFEGDPLQSAAGVVLRNLVHAPYIMRRLPALVTAAGFSLQSVEPHGYVQTTSPAYLLTLLSRGTDAAAQAGEIGQELVDSFDREALRRVANGSFYGAMLFLCLTARKDGD